METTQHIDQDVARLRGELQESPGSRFRLSRRGRYIFFGFVLILLMFFFGLLTKPVSQQIVVQETETLVDQGVRTPEGQEYQNRLLGVYRASQTAAPLPGQIAATTTVPRIITWSPASVGKLNADGTGVPMHGTYEIPGGWFALARVFSGKDEIGSIALDARGLALASRGTYAIDLKPTDGRTQVRLVLDAVKSCRLECSPLDQVCQSTNVNYCTALYDNQSFVAYTDQVAEALPPKGQCVKKTFIAGPKYSPQISEDYTMCTRGMWNAPPFVEPTTWLKNSGLASDAVVSVFLGKVTSFFSPQMSKQSPGMIKETGSTENVQWVMEYTKGDAGSRAMCGSKIAISVNCK